MSRAFTTRTILAAVNAVGAMISAAGCGGGSNRTRGSGSRRDGPSGTSGRPRAPRPRAHRREGIASTPRCRPADLVVWRRGDEGNAVGPSYYTSFLVSNLGRHACTLAGRPSLTAVSVGGRVLQLSRPTGVPLESAQKEVRVAVGGYARFGTSWGASGFIDPRQCRPVYAARYLVDLPGGGRTRVVPFPFAGRCTLGAPGRGISVGRFESAGPPPNRPPRPAPKLRPPDPREHLPACPPAKLVASRDYYVSAGAAALTSYERIAVTNLSGEACIGAGVPTVVAVDTREHAIGPPARKSPDGIGIAANGRHVAAGRIKPGGTAYFLLSVADPSGYGPDECDYRIAAGLRITLPGASAPQLLPMPIRRCPRRMIAGEQLSVGRIE